MQYANQAQIVKSARMRLQLTQEEFALRLGKDQSLISRYERGSTVPPGDIIMQCMHIMHGENFETEFATPDIAVADLAQLVLTKLVGPAHRKTRSAIRALIEQLTNETH